MKNDLPPACNFQISPTINCESTWPGLKEICHDASLEPGLQPLPGENLRYCSAIKDDQAHLDIAACREFHINVPTLMCVFSIRMLLLSVQPPYHLVFTIMSYKRRGLFMSKECMM